MKNLFVFAIGVAACISSADTFFNETFAYPDGTLTSANSAWEVQSAGGVRPILVSDEFISIISGSSGEDLFRRFDASSYPLETSMFAGATVNVFRQGPSTDYFMHFSRAATTTFRGRVFTAPGSDPAKFKFGISNASATVFTLTAEEFDLNTPYRVVLESRLDGGTLNTVHIIRPDGNISVSDVPTTPFPSGQTLGAIGLRQTTNNAGDLTLDDLIVATTFDEAANVSTGGATLSGIFALESRGIQSGLTADITIEPTVGAPLFFENVVLAADGSYSINVGSIGLATVTAKIDLGLAKKTTFNFGSSPVAFNATFLSGDADGNNFVDFDDLSAVATSYELDNSQPGFDPNADFTGDGVVDFDDLSVIATNYEISGE